MWQKTEAQDPKPRHQTRLRQRSLAKRVPLKALLPREALKAHPLLRELQKVPLPRELQKARHQRQSSFGERPSFDRRKSPAHRCSGDSQSLGWIRRLYRRILRRA